MHNAFSGLEKPDTASTPYPSFEYPSPLHHAHLAELETEAQLDLCDSPSSRWFDLDSVSRDDDTPTARLSPSSPYLRSLSPLTPSPPPLPSVHHIDLQGTEDEANFHDFQEEDPYWDGATQSPLSPSLRFSSLRLLDAEDGELHGLDLDFYDPEEEDDPSDAEFPSPPSPPSHRHPFRSSLRKPNPRLYLYDPHHGSRSLLCPA